MNLEWTTMDTWLVVLSTVCCMAAALPGCYLVLRRLSLMGDAISHAVLPGLAGAFMLSIWLKEQTALSWLTQYLGEDARDPTIMFFGAVTIGILTTLLTRWVHRLGQVDQGAAMGVVFTSLFALGLILIEYVAHAGSVDLDPECVLYGSLEFAADDIAMGVGGNGEYYLKSLPGSNDLHYPRLLPPLVTVLCINIMFILIFFKELKISTFDPDLANTQGIRAQLLMDALMVLIAITTVTAFEAVGSILVIGMLIIPPATALLLTDRICWMLLFSAILAFIACVLGHFLVLSISSLATQYLADTHFETLEVGSASMIVIVSGLLLLTAALFSPSQGILFRQFKRNQLRRQIREEDILGVIFRYDELQRSQGATGTTVNTLLKLPSLQLSRGKLMTDLNHLVKRDWLTLNSDRYELTPTGRKYASKLIRSHRLWEQFLHEQLDLPDDHVHATAEKLEHITTDEMDASLSSQLKGVDTDPHGRDIPQTAD